MNGGGQAGQTVERGVEEVRSKLNQLLQKQLPAEVADLVTPLRGKLNRARLLLAFAFGGEQPEPAALAFAQGVELLHLASLIQDDLVDQALLRHGVPTANRVIGAGGAVLLSDWLFGQAYHFFCVGGAGQINSVLRINRLIKAMALSELRQELALDQGRVNSVAACLRYNYYKTALFFKTCCQLGMQAAGGGDRAVALAGQIGTGWGMAYQLNNDIQDLVPGRDGSSGNDLDRRKGLLTLPLVLLVEKEPGLRSGIFRISQGHLWLKLNQYGCIGECGGLLCRFLSRSEQGLTQLELPGEAKQIILEWLRIMRWKGLMQLGLPGEGDPNSWSGVPQRIPTFAKEFSEK